MKTYSIFFEDKLLAEVFWFEDALDCVKWHYARREYTEDDKFLYICTGTEEILKINLKHH